MERVNLTRSREYRLIGCFGIQLLFLFSLCSTLSSQIFSVAGNVSTDKTPVSYVSVTFIDKSDTSKRISTITDSVGNFHVKVPTSISERPIVVPQSIELAQNYPNPFSTSTAISYKLKKQLEVSVKIFDIVGREVREFRSSMQSLGTHGIVWDGTDGFGKKVAAGVYFYKLQAKHETLVKKMIVGTGIANMNLPITSRFLSIPNALGKITSERVHAGSFAVSIMNIDSTKPKIQNKEYDNVVVGMDTTLNFIINKATSYNLYVGNWGFDQVYVVDTDSDRVVDTLRGFGSVWDVTPTKSGKKLYVTTRQGPVNYPGVVYSVDLETKQKKAILAKSADIYLKPNGIPLIIASTPRDSMRQVGIIDTVTDAIIFFDTLDIQDGGVNYEALAFDPITPVFYTIDNSDRLLAYDYEKRIITNIYQGVAGIVKLTLSMDATKMYCTVYSLGWASIDLKRDTLIIAEPCNYLGSLALHPNGEYLYITDPGKYLIPEPVPSGKIKIFETSSYSYIGSIDVNKASGQAHTMTDRMAIMPDGRKAYVCDAIANIFVLDLEKNDVVRVIKFQPRNITIRSLTLGVK